jgi:hypothetical protein
MKTYGDKVNNPINNYMSKEMNAPSRDNRLARGRARHVWRDLTGIKGQAHVVRRRAGRTAWHQQGLCQGVLNGGKQGEDRGEGEVAEAGGKGQG